MIGRILLARVLIAICLLTALWPAASIGEILPRPAAKWTVMIYMNGDNNLEERAFYDFREIASVGSTDKVNIVVLFDRKTETVYEGVPGWADTRLFYVKKGMLSLAKKALPRPAGWPAELDMGDGKTLRRFVEWTHKNFPAEKNVLVIWDHGDGFRRVTANSDTAERRGDLREIYRSLDDAPHRAVSHDESSGNVLFNRDIQENLQDLLKQDNFTISVLGFDACLMGMVEVGYAMRNVADVLVASEDLVPGNGWDYSDWLGSLTADPEGYDAEKLGKLLVDSYKRTYNEIDPPSSRVPDTTHAAVRLATKMENLAASIDELSDRLLENLDTEALAVRRARASCAVYAPCEKTSSGQPRYLNVDLGRFSEQLMRESSNAAVRAAAQTIHQALAESMIANYAGPGRQGDWGSSGLAIYFPPDKEAFEADTSRKDAYIKNGVPPENFPVEFVDEHHWSTFLQAYFAKLQELKLSGASAEADLVCQ